MSDPAQGTPAPTPISAKETPQTLGDVIRETAPDILNSIPQAKRDQAFSLIIQQRHSFRSGPLPDPAELEAYNSVIPNGADRIMKMAEAQSAHRIELEKSVIGSQQRQGTCGQVFGLIIGLTGLSLATYAAVNGQPWFGSAIGGTTLVGLVSAFLVSRSRGKAELAEKRQQIEDAPQRRPAREQNRRRRR